MLFSVVLLRVLHASVDVGSCSTVTRTNLAACASANNLTLASQQATVRAAEAKITAAQPVLPSNPTVSFSVARRDGSGPDAARSATNLYGMLSQEIEIAGQRGARIAAAKSGRDAEADRLLAVRRAIVARAWRSYFEAIAASEQLALAVKLEQVATDVARVIGAQAEKGVLASVDAQIANASAAQFQRMRLDAEREVRLKHAEVSILLGRDPLREPVTVSGELQPLSGAASLSSSIAAVAIARLPQVTALESEKIASEARASQLRRQRVPNPILSFIAQNDGFNERVLGGGLQLSVPLPWPIGKTNAGEIAEAEALATRAEIEREQLSREASLALVDAAAAYEASRASLAYFTPATISAAQETLTNLAESVASGRLAVRDVIISRQTLIELLRAHVETKLALAVASVQLLLASGVSLEGMDQ